MTVPAHADLDPPRPGRTRAQRYRAGKALRQKAPRSGQGRWAPASDRPDVLDLLALADRGRIRRLVPIRYGRMSLSPGAFLRGAANVMAFDLASTSTTGLKVQLAGDAHLSNFGVFATPERDRVFDVNDFDETLPGPWEWDLKRLATSLVVASRLNRFSPGNGRRAALRAMRTYRRAMHRYTAATYLDGWYSRIDLSTLGEEVAAEGRRVARKAIRRARRRTGLYAFPRIVERVRGDYRIRDDPPLISHQPGEYDARSIAAVLRAYRETLTVDRRLLLDRYTVADVAQKVVGVGSVGTSCWVVLLLGDADVGDPLFLQLKEATRSALEPYLGASPYANHAERVVVGQHLIQEASDIFLGWGRGRSRDFYLRQLRDMKFSSEVATFGPKAMAGQAELCGAALARSHARTGDAAAISGYLGEGDGFDRAIAAFAERYADQTERDHRTLRRAIRAGRIAAEVDV
ncbi:MAG TPA: DUF2252 domain-containing protein [Thermoplasmata archaeon]|nr:DUF2252 domain-containing protein [Thermoplasmata archaeon]